MNLAELFHQLVTLSLMGSVLAIGILLIKLLFRHKLSAHWHYYIWFLLILRLLVPYTPQSSFSLFNLVPHFQPKIELSQVFTKVPRGIIASTAIPDTGNTAPVVSSVDGNAPNLPVTARDGGNWPTAALIWLAGTLAISLYILAINFLLLLKSKGQRQCDVEFISKILAECKLQLKVQAKVSVVYDFGLKSPALVGLLRPKIMISPELIEKLSPEELRYVFLHELSHLKRRDLLANTLVMLIQVVYWFNPLIWYALHYMKQDCEIACDATALAAVEPGEHRQYGQTIINLLQLLSQRHWAPGTIGFVNKLSTRRIIMISSFRKATLKWTIAALTLALVVGCSSLSTPVKPTDKGQNQQQSSANNQQQPGANTPSTTSPSTSVPPTSSSTTPSTNPTDAVQALLTNMLQLAKQGKVINTNFPAKTTVIDAVEKAWGQADSTDYVAAAKGSYATFSSHKAVFGFNKGLQIFEVRSFDSQLGSISLAEAKQVLGTPAYDVKVSGQEIIGYTAGPEFKLELVFPQPTSSNPDPVLDHYGVLYPQGTVNSMADDPGRQW